MEELIIKDEVITDGEQKDKIHPFITTTQFSRFKNTSNVVYLSHTTAMDPSANICAGTRWLFQERAVAKERYAKIDPNHIVTWEDAVAEYKGVLSGILDKDNHYPDPQNKMPIFRSIYEKLQG